MISIDLILSLRANKHSICQLPSSRLDYQYELACMGGERLCLHVLACLSIFQSTCSSKTRLAGAWSLYKRKSVRVQQLLLYARSTRPARAHTHAYAHAHAHDDGA